MSLRIFHIIFIVVSVILSLAIALWGIRQFSATGAMNGLVLGIVFLAAAAAMIVYGKRTFRKLKDLS